MRCSGKGPAGRPRDYDTFAGDVRLSAGNEGCFASDAGAVCLRNISGFKDSLTVLLEELRRELTAEQQGEHKISAWLISRGDD
jgi:hypothetical protein